MESQGFPRMKTRFVDGDGILLQPWLQFLITLWRRTGEAIDAVVSSVSVVSANGVSGSVDTPNTTPAITIILGNITPSSVISSGVITGSNLSGTNTGDQTITLTGDVTGSGTGSFPATLKTVNSNVGSFTNSNITVDGKGRITAASTGIGGTGLSVTITTAKLTTGGTSGSMTFTSGALTAQTQAT